MALRTIGTNATSSLSGFVVGFNDTIPADVATLLTQMRGDPPGFRGPQAEVANSGLVSGQGAVRVRGTWYVQQGNLIIPNRGQLQLRPGDFICWDTTTGWPFVLSGDAAANGPYTHS